MSYVKRNKPSGNYSEGETPVPIPNTAVKPFSADGTALGAGWESRTLPGAFCCYGHMNIKGLYPSLMIMLQKRQTAYEIGHE